MKVCAMQDNTLGQSAYRPIDEDGTLLLPEAPPASPQVLARWAAFASQRAFPGFLPRQAETRV